MATGGPLTALLFALRETSRALKFQKSRAPNLRVILYAVVATGVHRLESTYIEALRQRFEGAANRLRTLGLFGTRTPTT